MTHIEIDDRLRCMDESPADHSKRMETYAPPPARHLPTKCGKVLHRKWVSKMGPVECPICWPTIGKLVVALATLPRKVEKLRRKLEVKYA